MEPGWAQIDAVRRHLHDHFTLDPDWRPTHGEVSPVQEFLFSSHRGPDYQFATAAALLLRSLGYTTRVVSGFYADARKYDHASRHTPITAQDVHFWTEVRIGGSDWVTLEPSPGYDVLGPPPGVWQQCRNAIASLASWCLQHWMLCAVACIAGVLLVQYRLALADVFATIRWRWVLWLMPDDAVVETLQLLQYRAALSGNRRAPSATYRRWLGELMALSGNPSMARPLYELRRSVDLAAYGGRSASSMLELVPVCRTCVRSCTLRWFRMLRVANSDTVLATATPRTVEDYHARFAGQR